MGMQDKMDFVIEEIIEEHLREQRNESAEYREIMSRLIELADQVQRCKSTMDEEVQKTLTDYSDTRNEIIMYSWMGRKRMSACKKLKIKNNGVTVAVRPLIICAMRRNKIG